MPAAKQITVQPQIAEEDEIISMTKSELASMMKDEVDKMKDDLMEMMREVKDAIGTCKTTVTKPGKTAAKKVEKTPHFLPFTGEIYPDRCQKICVHGGMFSQCQNLPEDGSNICKVCNKPTNNFPLIEDRLDDDGSIDEDWVAPDGRRPIKFGAYLHTKKIPIENAKKIVESATDLLGVEINIPDEWYLHTPGKPGRKKKVEKNVTVASDTEDSDDEDDGKLPPIKNAKIEKSKADEKKAAKEAEKEAKKAEKEAAKLAEKEAKRAARKAEKEAAKKAEAEAKEAEVVEEVEDEEIEIKASAKKSKKVKKNIEKVEEEDKIAMKQLDELSETFAENENLQASITYKENDEGEEIDMGKLVENEVLFTTRKIVVNDSDASDWESDEDGPPQFKLGSDSDSD
jgi:hypothetical protein